jgi:hypothetical protein
MVHSAERLRRELIGFVLVPLLAVAAMSLAVSPARADVCEPSAATLVRSNSHATVYKVPSGSRRVYYGCLRSSGRQTRLATARPSHFIRVGKLRLRGHFVAFVHDESTPGFGCCEPFIRAFNLANGAHIKRNPGAGQLNDLVVSGNGRLAWTTFYHFTTLYWSSFTRGRHDLKDDFCTGYDPSSDCIKPGSLHLTGRHHDREITWIEGRATKHFVIP